jgi:hypothetical protein
MNTQTPAPGTIDPVLLEATASIWFKAIKAAQDNKAFMRDFRRWRRERRKAEKEAAA